MTVVCQCAVTVIIIIIIIICYQLFTGYYITEAYNISMVYTVAAVAHAVAFLMIAFYCYICYRSQCTVHGMAVFCSSLMPC